MNNIKQENPDINITRLQLGPYDTNCYIVVYQRTGESVIIDAPAEPQEIIAGLKDTIPRYILLTHGHVDHVGALTELHSELHVPLAAHLGEPDLPIKPDIKLNDGDNIFLGDITLRVLHTPGHTQGSVCFLWRRYLFCGDTIFPGGPGYTRSTKDFRQIVASIKEKILTLPDDAELLPGHGAATNVGKEKSEYVFFISRQHKTESCGDVT